VYQQYGNAIAHGRVPYRDFAVEYPPGALPMFAIPGLAKPGRGQDVTPGFRHVFETLMWFCGAIALLAMAAAFTALRARRVHVWGALLFAALAPLALGSVVLSRYDLWPTALMVAAVAAFVVGWLRLGAAVLGAAITAKLFPAVLVPLAVAFVWRRAGRREALICLGTICAVVVLVFAPFVVLSPSGVWHSLAGQLTRPLQIESLGAALLIAAHHAWGHPVTMVTSHGSQNLAGHAADGFATAFTILQAVTLLAIWTVFARSRASRDQFVLATAASLATFVALGKVMSPQFLIWLVPIVPLVRGRRGLCASALLLAALILTQIWFPFRYWSYVNRFDTTASSLVLARDLLLVALLAVLALPRLRRG
jgi:Glycosyltransferase family 87